MESILKTIRSMLGPEEDYTHFDNDIMVYINSALVTLNQLGVGPEKIARVTSDADTWVGLLGDLEEMPSIVDYVYICVKLKFDPPTSSFVLASLKELKEELEWRLNVRAGTEV